MIKINYHNTLKFNFDTYKDKIYELVQATLKHEKVKVDKFKEIMVDINFVGEQKIRSLNKEHRNKDKSTDVLSFPVENPKESMLPIVMLGEIYICLPIAKKQAIEYNHSFKREFLFLINHGLLHLLGHDHIMDEDELKMVKAQRKIMKKIKVKRY